MSEEQDQPQKKQKCPECKPVAPLWMATFADMATLLMAFFVLILSFSQVKVDKYKAVVGSLANAFGMPQITVVPKGATLIPTEFSPSIASQAVMNQPNQEAIDPDKPVPQVKQNPESADFDIEEEKRKLEKILETEIKNAQLEIKLQGKKVVVQLLGKSSTGRDEIISKDVKKAGVVSNERLGLVAKVAEAEKKIEAKVEIRETLEGEKSADSSLITREPKIQEQLERQITRDVAEIKESLASQLEAGLMNIEQRDLEVAILLDAMDIFQDGGASINPDAIEPLAVIRDKALKDDVKIIIAGHTDNIPILNGGNFQSNWELSSARAASVAHAFNRLLDVPKEKIVVEAFADTRPIADNSTEEGRIKNRRIEVLLRRNQ